MQNETAKNLASARMGYDVHVILAFLKSKGWNQKMTINNYWNDLCSPRNIVRLLSPTVLIVGLTQNQEPEWLAGNGGMSHAQWEFNDIGYDHGFTALCR